MPGARGPYTVTKPAFNRWDLRIAAVIIATAVLGEPIVSSWTSPYGQCVRAVKALDASKPMSVAAVRARHPGAYDDLDDATLARALAAKARAEAPHRAAIRCFSLTRLPAARAR